MRWLETLSDLELITLFQRGDEQAFCALYKRYQQKIFSVILYYIKDRVMAEDLAQEAYIKIISSIKANRYCEEGKFLPWALRIVHNHCMDYLRKKNCTSYVSEFPDTVLASLTTSSPETKLMDQQAVAQIQRLVSRLSPEQKKVIYYRHFEEMSFKEISKLTNSSINTTLGRMRYALIHLRDMAQNHPAFS